MHVQHHILPTSDGERLLVRIHRPAGRVASRSIVIVHGACEHGGRYEAAARLWTSLGWRTIVVDLRGHGLSSGTHTHVDDFDRYVTDLEAVLEGTGCRGESTVLMGHSMGGLISIRFAQTHPDRAAGLLLFSPLLGVKVRVARATLALGHLVRRFAPKTRFHSRLQSSDTTRCPIVRAQRSRDPLVRKTVTASWYYAMRQALREAWEEASQLRTPTLLIQAGQDRVVCAKAAERWFDETGSPRKQFLPLPESFHDVLSEPHWRETIRSADRWLRTHLSAPPLHGLPLHAQPLHATLRATASTAFRQRSTLPRRRSA